MNRGAWTIATIFVLGVSMAAFAVWYQYNRGRRCLEFWGQQTAHLIRHAPQVELLILKRNGNRPDSDIAKDIDDSSMLIDGQPYRVVKRNAIKDAPGLIHARHALIVDANFSSINQPEDSPSSVQNAWGFLLKFTESEKSVSVVLSNDCVLVRELSGRAISFLIPEIAEAEKAFFLRQ